MQSEEACKAHVQATRPLANGATWGVANKKCFAESGMADHNNNADWRTCLFEKNYCSAWEQGVGIGGTKEHITDVSSESACSTYISSRYHRANGATWSATTHKCYAEFGMTGTAAGDPLHPSHR